MELRRRLKASIFRKGIWDWPLIPSNNCSIEISRWHLGCGGVLRRSGSLCLSVERIQLEAK